MVVDYQCLSMTSETEVLTYVHIENKLGIHGSPTCELVYKNAKAELCGTPVWVLSSTSWH